jgi:hypothetical protein
MWRLLTRRWPRVRRALWYLCQPVLRGSLRVARFYRPSFHETSPLLYKAADKLGVYPVIDHYHEPLIRPWSHLSRDIESIRHLPALDLQISGQLTLLRQLKYQDELRAIPTTYVDLTTPFYDNLAFHRADAQVLHSMIRHLRPKRVIEIGSGETSRFVARALHINSEDGPAKSGDLTCVEPYESPWLESLGVQVIRSKVEDLPIPFFTKLEPSDILFIDSSHVIRPGGDVLYLFNEVLPALAAGVVVHVHDVFTPRHYPHSWIEKRWLWDEQYLVEALLAGGDWLKVLLTVNHLYNDYAAELAAACYEPDADRLNREPGSLWLEVGARPGPRD